MSAVLLSIPSLHGSQSARGWALAVIVLLHVGFFFLISSGMGQRIWEQVAPRTEVVPVAPLDRPERTKRPLKPFDPQQQHTFHIPTTNPLPFEIAPDPQAPQGTVEPPPQSDGPIGPAYRGPIVVEPAIDPRMALSEPAYPSSEIRLNHSGTVLLSLYILENGRVDDVRIEQSSGYGRLDDSAAREARRWKFKPGTHDGVPIAMWKQVPITFQLK